MPPSKPTKIRAAPSGFHDIIGLSDRADFTVCGHLANDYAVLVTVGLPRFVLRVSKTLWSLIAATDFGPKAIDLINRRMFSVDTIVRRRLRLWSFVS